MVDDTTIIACSVIISMVVAGFNLYLDSKIDRIFRLIFKDKVTYNAQNPMGTSRINKKRYKGKCPVCRSKVTSKNNECPICGQRLNWRKYENNITNNKK